MSVTPSPEQIEESRQARAGLLYGLTAYGWWGLVPIYFIALKAVPAVDIVAHRIVWSLGVIAILLTIAKAWGAVRKAAADRKTLGLLACTAVLIAINWLMYVYANNNGHILATSIGYYLNPLANIVLGWLLLKERLSRIQWIAVAIAAAGVGVLAAGALDTLWISLTLCMSFAVYGLLRKIVAVESLPGLAIETVILAPIAIGWLALGGLEGRPFPAADPMETGLLIGLGFVSTIPLLCFTAAARRLPYSTVGMLQFLAPTLQFLLAVAVYREPFSTAHGIAFACIWTAMVLYVVGLMRNRRVSA